MKNILIFAIQLCIFTSNSWFISSFPQGSPEEEVAEFRSDPDSELLSEEVEGILPLADGGGPNQSRDGQPALGLGQGRVPQADGAMEKPRMKRIELEQFCFGRGDSFALGPCSATFLKCEAQSDDRAFSFEECPLGSVFVGKECKEARKVRECFLPEVNLLNDATEKVAQAVDFCARRNPFDATLHFFDGPGPEHKCSRQALICRGIATQPMAIGCPTGKVLNLKTLSCDNAPDQCAFVSMFALTPIRQHLLHLYCDQQLAEAQEQLNTPPLFPHAMRIGLQTSATDQQQRCRNWYAVCEHGPNPELVFCDSGKMFDTEKRVCRRILPEDQCPFIGACRGWEWRASPMGDCRSDFLFCNGVRPQQLQCERDGEVFRDGECKPAGTACDICSAGESKRSMDKCEEFFFCETDKDSAGRLQWRQYICTNSRVYHPDRRDCVTPDSYQCPLRTQCKDGDSYSVECGDFFVCTSAKYVPGKCPDQTKWDFGQKRCVYAPECRRHFSSKTDTKVAGGAACIDGQEKASADCKQYEECVQGNWQQRQCHDYASNRLKSPCRFCTQPTSPLTSIVEGCTAPEPTRSGRFFRGRGYNPELQVPGGGGQQQPESASNSGTYPLERLLPENFNPFGGTQGVRVRLCVEGEKVVNRHDCARFMECVNGDWFNMACPLGHFFNPLTQGCVFASSSNSTAIPMCQTLFASLIAPTAAATAEIKPAEGTQKQQQPQYRTDSVYLLPIVNYTLSDRRMTAIGPGAGPPPELSDKELRQNYAGAFDFCDGLSAQRMPNRYDCSRYRECALDSGGYYAEKQCTPGAQFDPALLKCTYDYTCVPAKCVENLQKSLQRCGRVRMCTGGEWHEYACAHGMAFVGGKCSDRIHCQSTNPSVIGHCIDGHTRAHATDCSKYLMCRYGQFVEENCYNGHRFNPGIGRCDPGYECPAGKKPPCYEGEMRSASFPSSATTTSGNCIVEYELCRDGRYERMSCPYGEHFEGGRCKLVAACSTSISTDSSSNSNNDNNNYNSGGGVQQTGTVPGVGPGEQCKESAGSQGFRSDRQNCAKFYQCAQGKWVPKDCAKGTVFNPALSVCDWPANVPGC